MEIFAIMILLESIALVLIAIDHLVLKWKFRKCVNLLIEAIDEYIEGKS